MSGQKANRQLSRRIEREVEDWPGVGISFEMGGRHPVALLSLNGKIANFFFSGSKVSSCTENNCIATLRRVLRNLGAFNQKANA